MTTSERPGAGAASAERPARNGNGPGTRRRGRWAFAAGLGVLALPAALACTGGERAPRASSAALVSDAPTRAATPLPSPPTTIATATATAPAPTAAASRPANTVTPTTAAPTPTASRAGATVAAQHTWYTSAAGNARYYYCDLDSGWKDLSPKNLRSYQSEAELRAAWGEARTKHPQSKC